MKKIYIIAILFGLLGFSNQANAQQPDATGFIRTYAQPGGLLTFDWVIGIPVGKMNSDFISETSLRGFSMEYRYLFNSPFSIGGGLTWQGFSQKYERSTYVLDGGAITSTRFNYLYNIPIFVNAHYYPLKSNYFFPFIGLGIGMFYIEKTDQIGQYYVQDDSWQFGLQPEIGTLIQINPGSGFGFVVKAKYNYMLYNKADFNSLSHIDFHVGASFVF